MPKVEYTENDLYTIAELTSQMEVDGHRADIVILKAAMAHAAFEGRSKIRSLDILAAAELALPHRLERRPFQDTELQFQQLERKLEQARAEAAEDAAKSEEKDGESTASQEKKTPRGKRLAALSAIRGRGASRLFRTRPKPRNPRRRASTATKT